MYQIEVQDMKLSILLNLLKSEAKNRSHALPKA